MSLYLGGDWSNQNLSPSGPSGSSGVPFLVGGFNQFEKYETVKLHDFPR